jgi:DNA-binding NarL/FixJ family response regulator
MRVIELLPRGLSNRKIGEELGISEHTVKSGGTLNARDRAEAAAIALREGLA